MNTYTIDNFPRTIEACMQATPSMRFRLMNQAGAFVSYEDKTAYGAAEPLQQAQLLLETLMNHDQKKNGAGGHPPMGAMQMPVGPQQALQPPMQQMAPQAPPPMAAPVQAPMQPHPAMTPGMPAPGSFGMPQMPQMPGMMAAPPQAPRAPAGPAPGQAMPQAPSFGMPAMPGPTFGQPPGQMPLPHIQPGFQGAPQAPQAPQAAQDDGRDPAPQTSGKGRGKGKGEATPDGGASAAILKKLAENNEQIIEGLANLAEGGAHALEMDKAIHAAVLGNAQLLKLVIIILTDFFGHMSNQPNGFQGFIPSWAQAAQNGTVEHLLQVMGQQGKV